MSRMNMEDWCVAIGCVCFFLCLVTGSLGPA